MTVMKLGRCPYNLDQFDTFDVSRRGKERDGAYLILKREGRSKRLTARISIPGDVLSEMHKCMDFDDHLEYRISKSARAIALLPGPNGAKLSSSSKIDGGRNSISMSKAVGTLRDMFGNTHYTYMMAEYYDGVTILRPTGKTEGTIDPEVDR